MSHTSFSGRGEWSSPLTRQFPSRPKGETKVGGRERCEELGTPRLAGKELREVIQWRGMGGNVLFSTRHHLQA